MKVKIKLNVNRDGSVHIKTVEGAGQNCKQVTDRLGEVLGKADEATRDTTQDYYVEGSTDTTVSNET